MSVTLSDGTVPAARPFRILGFTGAQAIAFLLLLAFVIAGPFVLYPIFLMQLLIFALFACAFNLLIGYVGLLSFGHAAFFGWGAYVAAWTAKFWHLEPLTAILLGGVVGAVMGLVFGAIAIRRQGIYFAMITLALGQMAFFIANKAPMTEGENGIQGVPRGDLLGFISLRPDMAMYALTATLFVAGFLLIHRIVHSPFGQVLKAIRENEPRAVSLGYRTNDYKLIAFVLSCFIAGIAGGLNSIALNIASLSNVDNAASGNVVLMTLLGGMGTIFGPVVGAGIIESLEHYLSSFGSWVTVAQGLIFVVCVLAFRRGIIGEIAAKLRIGL